MTKPERCLAAALALAAPAAAARAADLSVGNYAVSSYYVSAKAGGGGTCPFPAGTYLSAEYAYPGPSKTGAVSHTFLNGSSGALLSQDILPKTPASGATTWSGNVTTTVLPGGAPLTGTFSTTFTITDTKSYVDTTTYVFPSNGGTCTSVVQHVGISTGK